MTDKALISVVMPVYNARKFLSQAIESTLSQTNKNFEFIIVDDYSSDNSYQICEKYQKIDPRIKLFRNINHQGVGFTLNFAINKSKGQFLARMDADDIMDPRRLEKQVNYFQKNINIVCLGSWMKEINEKNKIIGYRTTSLLHKQIYEKMFYEMAIQNPTLMINKNLVPRDFSWCKTDGILDDLDLLFKLLQFGEFNNVGEYLMFYRIHENNLSLRNVKKTFNEALNIRQNAVIKYDYKPTLKGKIISFLEQFVVNFIPSQSLYFLYKIFRKINI
ncbi:hypothetical protein AUJ10_00410 [Candidatus Pacearchaeota archaeon CG1_02_31_27]|nr:MAG: hypothetical protein AUJ10_00410 [Candidatus Pacearchaeota archaeon CG1_02_31_27]